MLEAVWLRHYNIISLKRSDGRRPPEGYGGKNTRLSANIVTFSQIFFIQRFTSVNRVVYTAYHPLFAALDLHLWSHSLVHLRPFLTVNSSKTEFLLIGLSKQLAKIHKSSLNTTQSARNLGFIFDEHLTFSDQNSSVSKSYSSASLYPSITQYQNSFHHRHFHCSLQA